MTRTKEELSEFNRKINMYKTSEASFEVKKEAIDRLTAEFYGVDMRNDTILKDIDAGAADIDDIGGN